MTDNEIIERISNAVRKSQVVLTPEGQVLIYAEDSESIEVGKRYIYMMNTNMEHWRNFFQSSIPLPKI